MKRRSLFASVASSLTAILILAAGCSDQDPMAVQLEPGAVGTVRGEIGGRANVLRSTYAAGNFSSVIGPEGGTIQFGIGEITFPAGAVQRPTLISAAVDGEHLAVTFSPHGLRFTEHAQPVLSLSFAESSASASKLGIQYVDSGFNVLEVLETSTDIVAEKVTARLWHFSTYVIAGS